MDKGRGASTATLLSTSAVPKSPGGTTARCSSLNPSTQSARAGEYGGWIPWGSILSFLLAAFFLSLDFLMDLVATARESITPMSLKLLDTSGGGRSEREFR